MGIILKNTLSKEINSITTPVLQKFLIEMLDGCNDYNAIGPSSYSGKFHPPADNGIGGSIRHTRAVFAIVTRMMQCNPEYDNIILKEAVQIAALLHDMYKYDVIDGKVINNPHHAKVMSDFISSFIESSNDYDDEFEKPMIRIIASIIESHMSKWGTYTLHKGTSDEVTSISKTPSSNHEYLLCYADMVASMPSCTFTFDKDWNIV